jgi:hypothetical protein
VQRLGKNHGGYRGEAINVRVVLDDFQTAAQLHGWSSEVFHQQNGFPWLALRRTCRAEAQRRRIYISAGIHGDEPAGLLAALKLLRQDAWPDQAEIFLLPCLNPIGFTLNRRENAEGVDLNRDYRNPRSAGTRAHIAWLEQQPAFDLYLCLHEDWEAHGFYLYEHNPDQRPALAEKIITAVKAACPIDPTEIIEGRAAQGGVIRPAIKPADRPDWPEAFYLITQKSRLGYTLEAPSDFPLATRVDALVTAVNAAVNIEAQRGRGRPMIRPP